MKIKIQIIIAAAIFLCCIIIGKPQVACFILAIGMCLLLAVTYYQNHRTEQKIEEMTSYLMKVQDQLELPEMSQIQEGQLGILQSEIYKLVVLLGERYTYEKQGKRYLADMMSDISHQIKTPMAAITIMSDLLKQENLSEEKRLDYVDKIDRQIDRITWLVRNLLTLSRLEADMLPLKKEEVTVEEFLEELLEPFYVLAEVKNVKLNVQWEADIQMICDKHWTGEAISNIIKNSIEHTKEGGTVSIKVWQTTFSTNISIKDTGEGIAKEDLPYIFKRFYKAKNGDNSGVGIGLSLSKQIVAKQNGKIEVESEIGKGTEFIIKMYS